MNFDKLVNRLLLEGPWGDLEYPLYAGGPTTPRTTDGIKKYDDWYNLANKVIRALGDTPAVHSRVNEISRTAADGEDFITRLNELHPGLFRKIPATLVNAVVQIQNNPAYNGPTLGQLVYNTITTSQEPAEEHLKHFNINKSEFVYMLLVVLTKIKRAYLSKYLKESLLDFIANNIPNEVPARVSVLRAYNTINQEQSLLDLLHASLPEQFPHLELPPIRVMGSLTIPATIKTLEQSKIDWVLKGVAYAITNDTTLVQLTTSPKLIHQMGLEFQGKYYSGSETLLEILLLMPDKLRPIFTDVPSDYPTRIVGKNITKQSWHKKIKDILDRMQPFSKETCLEMSEAWVYSLLQILTTASHTRIDYPQGDRITHNSCRISIENLLKAAVMKRKVNFDDEGKDKNKDKIKDEGGNELALEAIKPDVLNRIKKSYNVNDAEAEHIHNIFTNRKDLLKRYGANTDNLFHNTNIKGKRILDAISKESNIASLPPGIDADGAEVLIDNDDFSAIRVWKFEASSKYGLSFNRAHQLGQRHGGWCVSSTEGHFKSYTCGGSSFVVITPKTGNDGDKLMLETAPDKRLVFNRWDASRPAVDYVREHPELKDNIKSAIINLTSAIPANFVAVHAILNPTYTINEENIKPIEFEDSHSGVFVTNNLDLVNLKETTPKHRLGTIKSMLAYYGLDKPVEKVVGDLVIGDGIGLEGMPRRITGNLIYRGAETYLECPTDFEVRGNIICAHPITIKTPSTEHHN